MPAAIIGGAIAGVGAIGAAAIGSSASKKASQTAAQAAQDATTQNNTLARDIYGQNKEILSPFLNRGNAAGGAINALLGLGGPAMMQVAPANDSAYYPSNDQGGGFSYVGGAPEYGAGPGGMATWKQIQNGGWEANPVISERPYPTAQSNSLLQLAPSQSPTDAYRTAFDNYRNSTGYDFRVREGEKGLNSGYAAKGLLNSGAAQKSMERYRQDYASGEFGNYLTQLGNQQNVGLSAGNALAGVGTGYSNAVASQNNAQAGVLANAALANGQASGNLYGTAANALGQIGGTLISSYRPSAPTNAYGISGAGNIY